MRALLFHCKQYGVKIVGISTRPKDIIPEEVKEKDQDCRDCVVVFVTVEKNDEVEKTSSALSEEVAKMCKEVGHKNIVLFPFAHLSNNLAKTTDGITIISHVENILKKDFDVIRAHFGSHKELLLHTYGHPCNARYREF